jgi:cytochrome c oxidase subunit I
VIGFMGLFLIGGLTGLYLATLGLDIHLTDTYFVVAHFHYIMVGGAIMAFLGGLHFWWPKMTGRMYPESLAKVSAILVFVGFNGTFFPQFLLGYLGMPRRYHAYPEDPLWQVLNVMSTTGATILGLGYGLCLTYFVWSLFKGARAPQNPWGAKGLEWEKAASPPTTFNFEEDVIVTEPAYNYQPAEKVHHG